IHVDASGVTVGTPTAKPIPITDIDAFVNRQRPQTRCLSLDQIKQELCKRGYLPPALCTTTGSTGPTVGPPTITGDDPCSEDKMDEKIGRRSVVQVIKQSSLGEKIGGKPVKPNQPSVLRKSRSSVCDYASRACKGSAFP